MRSSPSSASRSGAVARPCRVARPGAVRRLVAENLVDQVERRPARRLAAKDLTIRVKRRRQDIVQHRTGDEESGERRLRGVTRGLDHRGLLVGFAMRLAQGRVRRVHRRHRHAVAVGHHDGSDHGLGPRKRRRRRALGQAYADVSHCASSSTPIIHRDTRCRAERFTCMPASLTIARAGAMTPCRRVDVEQGRRIALLLVRFPPCSVTLLTIRNNKFLKPMPKSMGRLLPDWPTACIAKCFPARSRAAV